jgi:hypothetical protein
MEWTGLSAPYIYGKNAAKLRVEISLEDDGSKENLE